MSLPSLSDGGPRPAFFPARAPPAATGASTRTRSTTSRVPSVAATTSPPVWHANAKSRRSSPPRSPCRVKLDYTELLAEIARQMTSALRLPVLRDLRIRSGPHAPCRCSPITTTPASACPTLDPIACRRFRSRAKVLEEGATELVNVDDPQADAAEVAELRREGDKSLLMVPLVFQGGVRRPARTRRQQARTQVLAPGAAPLPGDRRSGCGRLAQRQGVRRQRRSDKDVANLRAALASLRSTSRSRPRAPHERRAGTVDRPSARRSARSPVWPSGRTQRRAGDGRVGTPDHGDERGASVNLVVAHDPSGRPSSR